ncbi:hypothetical protein DCAR_0207430 [Daucus carota subsp. sativus]|uniref:BRCT domain-containing protein n=1 Tax=Daucus carota subsp. sativus TaxID=79200 RepID=A0AAF0WGL6_DAUCS|nr:hypothetical protein DCAR_0207430 [Daucus carota subsp. sativus]
MGLVVPRKYILLYTFRYIGANFSCSLPPTVTFCISLSSMVKVAGFRPPQFSEDVNWLPPWLQPCESAEQIQGLSQFKLTSEELPCLNTVTREDANFLITEEGRYKSCHLFLSAEDNSPLTFASSSGNVPKFHLHLSTDDDSENKESQFLEISQAEISEPDHSLKSIIPEDEAKKYKYKGSQYAGSTNLPTNLLEKSCNPSPQCTGNNLDNGAKSEDHVKPVEVDDITAAVELSIAASEALLIHEIIDSGQTTNSLSASAILEVALRVKQARLEGYIEASNIMHEETSDVDYLSDLDDSMMKGAYEDVGLNLCDFHLPSSDLNISQVNDTYSLENCNGDEKMDYEDAHRLGVNSADLVTKLQPNDSTCFGIPPKRNDAIKQPEDSTCFGLPLKGNDALVPFDNVKQKKFSKDLSQGPGTLDMAFDMNVLETPDIISTTNKAEFRVEDFNSLQVTLNTSHPAMILEEKMNDFTNKAQEKFRSRWFGGWTHKAEVNSVVAIEHNSERSIPAFVIGETSILSESADIAPDENSFVQKQDKVSNLASQSSIPSNRLHTESIKNKYVDEDIMISSTSSMGDPLCSFVPCSISLENACSGQAQNHIGQAETHNSFPPINKHNGDIPERSSSVDNFICGQKATGRTTDSVVSQLIARRQVTTLKTYSMLLPSNGPYLGNEKCDHSFPLQCKYNKLDSSFPSSMANTIDGTRNLDESAKEASKLVFHDQEDTGALVNLNCGSKFFDVSKSSLLDINGEEDPEHRALRNKDGKVLQINNLRMAEEQNGIVPGRKRVRFAETNSSFPQKKKAQMMDPTISKRSKTDVEPELKAIKRRPSKISDKSLKRRIFQNLKFLLTGFSSKKEKEIEGLIRTYGGIVLPDVPSPPTSRALRSSRFKCQLLPVILCSRKLQTLKFLYGCAIKACLVTVDWLKDSICAGSVLPTKKYIILPNLWGDKYPRIGRPTLHDKYIFDHVGIMLHGKPNFCNKIAQVIRHGGGLIFKTLHVLVQAIDDDKISTAAIVTENENGLSRHLKHCALERKIPLMPETWIIQSLYAGKLLPVTQNNRRGNLRPFRLLDIPVSPELSQEI